LSGLEYRAAVRDISGNRGIMPNILIIGDDERLLGALESSFGSHSYQVYTAQNGVEGLRKVRQNPVDIVITDILMPEKEGLETIQEFRRDFPDVKIIAMSGGGRVGTNDYLRVAELYGAGHVFKKPFRLANMLSAVEGLIGAKAQ